MRPSKQPPADWPMRYLRYSQQISEGMDYLVSLFLSSLPPSPSLSLSLSLFPLFRLLCGIRLIPPSLPLSLFQGSKNVVHRDLATRNVLVVSDQHVKIADFGLARQFMENRDYYRSTKRTDLPVYW